MSEEKQNLSEKGKSINSGWPKVDQRLLSVPNLCSMYDVFSREHDSLNPDDPEGARCAELLQSYIDVIIGSLRLRLVENRQAELDLGFGSPAAQIKSEENCV